MQPIPLLVLYCLLVLAASLAGGLIPFVWRITHRWMEFMISFVAGVMLGVGILHLLPHALAELPHGWSVDQVMQAALAGFLIMFLIERFFCFHHHDAPDTALPAPRRRDDHAHDLTWSGAALGLTIHSVIGGIALGASVTSESHGESPSWAAGLGTFLVIFLHKPFDSMTLATLMARGGWSHRWRHLVNTLFALATAVGVVLFLAGFGVAQGHQHPLLCLALAFSAGTFLCIAMSDLLPELQFHQHDRVKLTCALLAGLTVAYAIGLAEPHGHHPSAPDRHDHSPDR
jgi:zinc and cadmium transporter